jgi:hypothetical protein
MSMADTVRFDRIMALSPRRFHISANPPFGLGIVICSHLNEDDVSVDAFTANHDGIANCKPGIWRSTYRAITPPEGQWSSPYNPVECIVHWVADGTIDLAQPVKDWEEYDKNARQTDATVDLDNIFLKGVEWESRGTFFDDGGLCAVLSTEYLTREAATKIASEIGQDKESDEEDTDNEDSEEEEDFKMEFYLERITVNTIDWSGEKKNAFFTLGGMNCTCLSALKL